MSRYYSGADGFRNEPKLGIEILRGYRGFKLVTTQSETAPGGIEANLRALSWSYWWTPGNNKATCLAAENSRLINIAACRDNVHPESPYTHTPDCPRYPECEYPTLDCACGFYAYFTRGQHWGTMSIQVSGVIEGWGRSVVGDLGFRSQWGRIVALCRAIDWPPATTYKPICPDLADVGPGDFRNSHEAQRIEAAYLSAAVSRAFPNVPTYPDLATMLEAHPMQGGPE